MTTRPTLLWQRVVATTLAMVAPLVVPATALSSSPPAQPVAAVAASANQTPPVCFSETGFCIQNPQFLDYFRQRGGTRILGYPVSREMTLEGFRVQFFQRVVLQLQGDRVERLNILDESVMPMTRANQSVFAAPDPSLAGSAPQPDAADYGQQVVEFVRSVAPDTWNGLQVRFFNLFNTTVPIDIAFGGAPPNPALVTLLNLEIWGLPTAPPAFDPRNRGFVYQRFQRGIMHFRADCVCTDGILVGDYLKAVITGRNLPADLDADMRNSRFYKQYAPGSPNWLARPGALSNTNLTNAFEPGTGNPPAATATPTPTPTPTPVPRPKLTISAADLQRLNAVLSANRLSPSDVNTARTVTSALPGAMAASGISPMVLMAAPLTKPPSADASSLSSAAGVVVGVLKVGRTMPLSDSQVHSLPPDLYLVKVQNGRMIFVNSGGQELATSLRPSQRTLRQNVPTPISILTARDTCFSWNRVQVCSEPSASDAFTSAEKGAMSAAVEQAVADLSRVLGNTAINTAEYVPDVEGIAAVNAGRASILAAPTADFPAPGQEVVSGRYLGIVVALLDVDVPGFPSLPKGTYAVRAMQTSQGQWRGQFTDPSGKVTEIPAEYVEIRGDIAKDGPMAIVVNLRIGLCFWEC